MDVGIVEVIHRAVALRKESVDRNRELKNGNTYILCRSPQGERG